MAVIVNKDEDQNDALSARINADLMAKMAETTQDMDGKKDPDMVEESDYVKDLKRTGRFAWVWMIVVVIVVIVAVAITLSQQGE